MHRKSRFMAEIFLAAFSFLKIDSGSLHLWAESRRNIRDRSLEEGLYLTPLPDAKTPEVENFTTTTKPLAMLTEESIQEFLKAKPELSGYRVVLIGAPVRGDQARKLEEFARAQITDSDFQIFSIRHPQGLREKLTNLWPRREDYEKPLPSELKVASAKILVAGRKLSVYRSPIAALFAGHGLRANCQSAG